MSSLLIDGRPFKSVKSALSSALETEGFFSSKVTSIESDENCNLGKENLFRKEELEVISYCLKDMSTQLH
jgi:hypothetical protein